MKVLSPILRTYEEGHVTFWCPGCNKPHAVRVEGGDDWMWNKDADAPTFTPSVLNTSGHHMASHIEGNPCWCTFNAEHPDDPSSFTCNRCHSYVVSGHIQFLHDCSHDLAGRTIPMVPFPENFR